MIASTSANAGSEIGGRVPSRITGVRVRQQRGSRCHDDRAQVVLPVTGGVGDPDFGEDPFDQPVEQCRLVGNVVIDGHRVDSELCSEPAHRQPLEPLLVDDPQRRLEHLGTGCDRGAADLAAGASARV